MALLETARQRSAELEFVERRIKKRIQEVVRSYRNSWDPYSELVQNSVDAINRRFRILNDPDFHLYEQYREEMGDLESDPSYRGRLHLDINAQDKTITICDNGVGMMKQDIENFLLPEGTDKQVGQEYGFKGYGLTYAAFISDHADIISGHFLESDSDGRISLKGLFEWLCDENEDVEFPDGPIPDVTDADVLSDDWSTKIHIQLAEEYSNHFPSVSACDHTLDYARSNEYLDGLEYMLRTHTAIGNTRPLFNKAPIVPIDVTADVTFPDGSTEEGIEIPYQYYHPKDHDQISFLSFGFKEYFDEYKKPTFDKDFRALYHAVKDEVVGSRSPIQCDFALTAIASSRLSDIESSMGLDEIESSDIGISYGVHLAIDGMPLGLRVDNWDAKGGNIKRYHIVVNAELDVSNQLDSGRKGISRYYGRLISDKALELIGSESVDGSQPFASYASRHLDHGRGRPRGGLPPQDFQAKISDTRDVGSEQSDELKTAISSISNLIYCPTDEQEVVALFYQLLTHEIIKGYKVVYHAGPGVVYDAAYEYEIECDSENVYPNDQIGIGRVLVEDLRSAGLSTYKHSDHYSRTTYLPELCVEIQKKCRWST
jgi:hypothetical protein